MTYHRSVSNLNQEGYSMGETQKSITDTNLPNIITQEKISLLGVKIRPDTEFYLVCSGVSDTGVLFQLIRHNPNVAGSAGIDLEPEIPFQNLQDNKLQISWNLLLELLQKHRSHSLISKFAACKARLTIRKTEEGRYYFELEINGAKTSADSDHLPVQYTMQVIEVIEKQ